LSDYNIQKFIFNLRESSGLHNLAGGSVVTRVTVASVDDGLAVLAVEAGSALAVVVSVGQWATGGSVLTRIVLAEVAFGQNSGVNIT
jgi:hypothetical protein